MENDLALKEDALEQVRLIYEDHLVDEMGKLKNRFVAYISESRLPIPQVILVLEMLKQEAVEMAITKYVSK